MELIRLVAGLLLPWAFGIATVAALRPRSAGAWAAGELPWTLGAGYFTGAFLLTMWMRALSAVRIDFGAISIAVPILVATAALAVLGLRRAGVRPADVARSVRIALGSPVPAGRARTLWWILVWLLVARFVLLGIEVGLRPLYPWDAWIQWATKARVWYEWRHLVPFGRAEAWFAANGAIYFDASPEYPPTMPLLQVWSCIALGRWDDALMNWPWWQVAAALCLAVYGGLRSLRCDPMPALVGAFMVGTLPLVDVHVALAGYADLPMAAYYTVAALALLRWQQSREWRDAAMTALLAVACTQIKNPGIVWALTLAPAAVVILMPRHGLRVAAFGLAGAVFALAVLAQTHAVIFNYQLHLDFDPAWGALGQSLFFLANWNLLWYAAIAAAVLAGRSLLAPRLAPLTIALAAGLLFLLFVFAFTNARAWVADQRTVNRATLHLAPVVAVFVVLAFQAFAERWRGRNVSRESADPVVAS